MSTAPVLFLVGAGPQLHSARRVSAYLERPAQLLDLWNASVVELDAGDGDAHIAPATLGRLRAVAAAVRAWARANPAGVVVTPQDVGLVYRRAIAVARGAGLSIVLMPDGAVSELKLSQRSLLGGVVPVVDAALRGARLFAGVHGVMAASRPDLVLSWGHGWDHVYAARGVTNVVDVGNPRADGLDALPAPQDGRILLCSQPPWLPFIGGEPTAVLWYDWLETLAATAPEGGLKVRLHPQERDRLDELPVGAATRAVLTHGTTFHHDLAWSGAVVAWSSTTMIEAAGAGRPVVSVTINEAARQTARTMGFNRDPRMVMVPTNQMADWPSAVELVAKAKAQQEGLADDYLVNVGSAAKSAAAALDAWGG
jgi:hypothetical protein